MSGASDVGRATYDRRAPLLGALILSAAGSVPAHLAPLAAAAAAFDGRLSIASAGLIASAGFLGQLTSALLLPVLEIGVVSGATAALWALLVVTGLCLAQADNVVVMISGWYVVGVACGALKFLGNTSAARAPHLASAFSLRLSLVLILSGAAALFAYFSGAKANYDTLLKFLLAGIAPVLFLGWFFYQPPDTHLKRFKREKKDSWSLQALCGLALVSLFFVGQSGFMAYVVITARSKGLTLTDATWMLATAKLGAGLCLVVASRWKLKATLGPELLAAFGLMASIAVIRSESSVEWFWVYMFCLELCLNTVSAYFLAAVVAVAPMLAGAWIGGTILAGQAIGAPLHGLAIGHGLGWLFFMWAMTSALIPLAWRLCSRSPAKR